MANASILSPFLTKAFVFIDLAYGKTVMISDEHKRILMYIDIN